MFMILCGEEDACLYDQLDPDDESECLEVTGLFLFSNLQYVATVMTYTKGDDFREDIHRNEWFLINIVFALIASCFLLFANNEYVEWIGLVEIEDGVKIKIMIGTVINFALTYVFELIIKELIKLFKKQKRYY